MAAPKKDRPPVIDQLRKETGSNDPMIAGAARQALSALGRKGAEVRIKKRRIAKAEEEKAIAASAEEYRRRSRGG
jgi:hypothetical protein